MFVCVVKFTFDISFTLIWYRLREERTDDRPQVVDQKPRDLSSRNGMT